jgi:hypothetical protein
MYVCVCRTLQHRLSREDSRTVIASQAAFAQGRTLDGRTQVTPRFEADGELAALFDEVAYIEGGGVQ